MAETALAHEGPAAPLTSRRAAEAQAALAFVATLLELGEPDAAQRVPWTYLL